MKPNFIIIGAGKSGTTSLYEYLVEHPQVLMSEVKETNYFALKGQNLNNTLDDPDQLFYYPRSITTEEQYCQLFAGRTSELAVGEASPMYLYHPDAPGRIREELPDVKLIAILREPVDRLYSRYLHLARENRQPSDDLLEALDRDSIWWGRDDLVREGMYYTYLRRYYDLFDKDQIKVFLYDDLRQNPAKVIQEFYRFIGVDDTFVPDMDTEYNVSGIIKNQTVDKLIGQNSVLKKALHNTSPAFVDLIRKQAWAKRLVYKFRNKNMDRPKLDLQTRSLLFNELYKAEVDQLQHLINRDLHHWSYDSKLSVA